MSGRLLTLSGLLLALFASAGRPAVRAAEVVQIDTRATGTPFPHFWERMFGSGRAILSLRASYRDDLRSVRAVTGFGYVRFHAILDDDVGVCTADKQGRLTYNFSYVDQIYDGLLDAGVRPMVELSFMPKALASSDQPQNFWYKPLPNPPKDYAQWAELVRRLAEHLVGRYGLDEVSQWYFEVWNEPNIDFWMGEPKQETYFQLYDSAAKAIKTVSPRLRVGGPATAQAAWVADFIRHCVAQGVPVDFITTHIYGSDTPTKVFGTKDPIPRSQLVALAAKKVCDEVRASARPELPIIWSEYNATSRNDPQITDTAFMGPWLANTIRQCDGLAETMSYWTFSDVFEEGGVVKKPFYGGFGLIAAGHIPKAAYQAFALLHRLGERRLPAGSDSALATKTANGSLAIALWNYADPGPAGAKEDYRIELEGWTGAAEVRLQLLDDAHGSSQSAWKAMGSPAFPSREQQAQLIAAAQLPAPEVRSLSNGSLELTLPPHALALLEIGASPR